MPAEARTYERDRTADLCTKLVNPPKVMGEGWEVDFETIVSFIVTAFDDARRSRKWERVTWYERLPETQAAGDHP